jgi:ribosomal protein S18 acetylase RimI-like enzyme
MIMNKQISVSVREAKPQDSSDIARIHVASWRAAYKGIVKDSILKELDVTAREKTWGQILAQTEFPCYLAASENYVFGFAHISRSRDSDRNPSEVGEITSIYVDPDKYRQGNGKLLMNHAMQFFIESGFSQVDLWVLDGNHLARRFYEHLGFVEEGESKLLGRLGLKELRYTKSIHGPDHT